MSNKDKLIIEFMRSEFRLGARFNHNTSQDCQINKLIELAISYYLKECDDEAIGYLKKALKICKREDIYNIMGIVYFFSGKYTKSYRAFQTAFKADCSYLEPYYNIGALLSRIDRLDFAIRIFDSLLEHSMISKMLLAEVYNARGWVYCNKGEEQKSIKLFEVAMLLNKHFVCPCVNLGNVYLYKSNLKKAKKHYKKALEIDESCAVAYNNLGILAMQEKDFEKAKNCFDKAISLETSYHSFENNKKFLNKYKQGAI